MRVFHFRKGQNQSEHFKKFLDEMLSKIYESCDRAEVSVKPYKPKRSLSANALYWMWIDQMTDKLQSKGMTITVTDEKTGEEKNKLIEKDDTHDLMREKFLGYEIKVTRRVNIRTLVSTTSLNKSEFCHYMEQVYHFANEYLSLVLPTPLDSEYQEYLNRQCK